MILVAVAWTQFGLKPVHHFQELGHTISRRRVAEDRRGTDKAGRRQGGAFLPTVRGAKGVPRSDRSRRRSFRMLSPTAMSASSLFCQSEPFWEKATILHQEAHRTGTIPARYSRHYYDLYKLAGSAIKESSLARLGLLKDVVAFKERRGHGIDTQRSSRRRCSRKVGRRRERL